MNNLNQAKGPQGRAWALPFSFICAQISSGVRGQKAPGLGQGFGVLA